MKNLREFYGDTIIDKNDYNEFDGEFKIHLTYYKTQDCLNLDDKNASYGMQVVKKQTDGNSMKVETKEFSNIVDTEEKVDNILEILKRNKVTPVAVRDVLEDMKVL
ncbi:MAG: hypothetical protein J6D03_11250 [Clostridia bacterium]|nr:hypothetical protein [Clostridia bacterium]